jgi:hypothetical protein
MKSYYANKEQSTKGPYLPVDDGDLSVGITGDNSTSFIEGKLRAFDGTSISDSASPQSFLLVAVHCLSPIHQINPDSKVVQICVTIVIYGKVARIITNDTVPLAVQHGIGSIQSNHGWPALLCVITVI